MHIRTMFTLLTSTLMLAGPALVTSPVALAESAAQSCSGPSCDQQDPFTTGCVDTGRANDAAFFQGRTVRLFISSGCRAAWAELTGGQPTDRISIQNTNGRTLFEVVPPGGISAHTPMVDDLNIKAQACLFPLNSSAATCTRFF
jgi:hypothetical protein